jgi:hypothetical protein
LLAVVLLLKLLPRAVSLLISQVSPQGMEDEEEADVPEMVPQLGWHMPPLLGAKYQPPSTWAAGEESQEKTNRLSASQQDHQRPGEYPEIPLVSSYVFFNGPSTLRSLN